MSARENTEPPAARSHSEHGLSKSELHSFFTNVSRIAEAQHDRQPIAKTETACLSVFSPNKSELDQFFTDMTTLMKEQQRRDLREATGFNIFDLIEPDENKLSDILADLLDPKGKHGQGDAFLRLLFEQLKFDGGHARTSGATVQREAPTHGIEKYRRRMDVLVCAGVLLAVENKVDSLEQPDQVKDYLEHLDHCTRGCGVPYAFVYLTPNGRPPASLTPDILKIREERRTLYCWSYKRELRDWLERCVKQCEAKKTCYFLSDFIAYIDSKVNPETIKQHKGGRL